MTKNRNNHPHNFLLKDAAIVSLSVLIAIILVRTHTVESIVAPLEGLGWLGSFIAGIFYTSIFTTAPAIVVLGSAAHTTSIFVVAFWGALGAIVGDLVMFVFMKDRLSEDVREIAEESGEGEVMNTLLKLKFFRWVTFILAGLIIASPLPDEIGLSLLGLSRIKMSGFFLISLVFNFLGILLIGLVAKSL